MGYIVNDRCPLNIFEPYTNLGRVPRLELDLNSYFAQKVLADTNMFFSYYFCYCFLFASERLFFPFDIAKIGRPTTLCNYFRVFLLQSIRQFPDNATIKTNAPKNCRKPGIFRELSTSSFHIYDCLLMSVRIKWNNIKKTQRHRERVKTLYLCASVLIFHIPTQQAAPEQRASYSSSRTGQPSSDQRIRRCTRMEAPPLSMA